MVEVFENALEDYKRWSETNQHGYVLNVKPGGVPAMLHRTTCGHIYPEKPEYGDFTRKKKVCSTDRQSLETWAKQSGTQIVHCSNCDV
jgi:hypothetical protein